MNPFDWRSVVLAKHAQHVVLVHFPIALFIAAVGLDVEFDDGPLEVLAGEPARLVPLEDRPRAALPVRATAAALDRVDPAPGSLSFNPRKTPTHAAAGSGRGR